MKVDVKIINILEECTYDDKTLFLPNIQLSRPDYVAVNKVLELLGGKWNRKVKGHIFEYSPEEAVENVILTGEITDIKKDFQFFPTPTAVVEQMLSLADIKKDSIILEPSCGKGNIADAIHRAYPNNKLLGIELNSMLNDVLKDKPYEVLAETDFLQYNTEKWDRIVMNPPFSKMQDIDHILHAYDLLASDGILVSVCSMSPFYRTCKKAEAFREFVDSHNATVIKLPEGAFKESGTMVQTCIVVVRK